MKKYLALITSASLCLIASQAFAASKPPKDTIWEYKGDGGKTLWQVCGSQNSTSKIVGSTKHYVAVLNRKSASGCAFGDFYIVARTDGFWQQRDTGTCSPNAYIQKGTINNGQYSTVDIGVGGTIVAQYPIGYWSQKKELSGKNRPRWKEKDRTQGGLQFNMKAYEDIQKYGRIQKETLEEMKREKQNR
ncbi:hypothetical protein [Proteus mirabilis]|uniref:hypothetical protein n=1 Tax=Proteus mirabilis TaxID=584 RepID=UPI00202CD52A|nr:hypothetical protein [Proteus mirabilis]MCL9989693.1 hypothetical protein [Proteus mirabilis]MCT8218475.1 hypothetical protein [Proteus mirabilis]